MPKELQLLDPVECKSLNELFYPALSDEKWNRLFCGETVTVSCPDKNYVLVVMVDNTPGDIKLRFTCTAKECWLRTLNPQSDD